MNILRKQKFAVFFDRDGTLIHYRPYLSNPRHVKVYKNVRESIIKLKKNNVDIFLHTNQSGIKRGFFSHLDVERCNEEMLKQIGLGNRIFKNICIATDLGLSSESYRKPSTRFVQEMQKKYGYKSNEIYYVGDNFSDADTALNFGAKAIGLKKGIGHFKKIKNLNPHLVIVNDIKSAVEYIINSKNYT